jgi:hypothetical protein
MSAAILLLYAALAAAAAPPRGDVSFEQKVTTTVDGHAGQPVTSRVYWSGRRIRLESGDPFDPLILLVDLGRNRAYRLQTSTRKALVIDLDRLRSQAHLEFSTAGDQLGADVEDAFRTQALPGRRVIAGHACDGYQIRGGTTRMDVWTARRVPLDMDLFTEFLEWSGADQSLGGLLPEMRKLPGFPLETRTRVTAGAHVYETQATVTSLEIAPIAAALLEVPEDYAVENEPDDSLEP